MDFVKNTKFMSPKAKPVITFMQNSLVEIFSLDVHLTYQHAFVYIRQLAIHLRNAMVRQKKVQYLLKQLNKYKIIKNNDSSNN